MTLTPEQALALSTRAVQVTADFGADQAEAVTLSSDLALTRFANNRIHQNTATRDVLVSVRAVVGRSNGVASTNKLDDDSLRDCCASALDAARRMPPDEAFPGLPAPRPVSTPDRGVDATRAVDAEGRARVVSAIVGQCESRGQVGAGTFAVSDQTCAVANSLGVAVSMPVTSYRATVLAMHPDGGSGWASATGRDAGDLAPEALGDRAATLASRSANPESLEPGSYVALLAPDAVASMVEYLGYFGISAKAVEEGRSFMSGHIGEKLMSSSVTLLDDALAEHSCGLTFDFEGMPKQRVTVIEDGTIRDPVTDSYWAARTGRDDTGHALPAPNPYGPLPLDLALEPGDATPQEMIASVERGIYVTRFHYLNIEDPVRAVMTGMTRDGTFLIENGHLTRPLRNLRFTQSAIEALAGVRTISDERHLVGEEACMLVPYLLLDSFAFTGQTA